MLLTFSERLIYSRIPGVSPQALLFVAFSDQEHNLKLPVNLRFDDAERAFSAAFSG